jgi:NADPH-dependent glutamate synthase beta subunit-like oxidoreductase
MPVNVAIIGSGPSAFYTADALIGSEADVRIDMIERLPTPFGLVRGGVAPDHQSTKWVARAYEKTALSEPFHFYGNVNVGQDITLSELRNCYDAVVLAVGMPADRPLEIPGADKMNVIGSAAFVGWYNGLPEFCDLDPDLNTTTISVIGNGNVALDITRVLVKTEAEMAASDIAYYATEAIRKSPLTDVHTFGRRGPVECKFTNVELREMGHLEDCVPVVDAAQLPDYLPDDLSDRDRRLKAKNLTNFWEFAAFDPASKSKRVHFQFYANPVEILGEDRVEGLRLERTHVLDRRATGSGDFFEVSCGLVVYAIGYGAEPMDGVQFDPLTGTIANTDGRVDEGLYAVGWIKRGPTGVIGTNKHDGDAITAHIREDIPKGQKLGREALEKLLAEHGTRWVSYADWQKIDAAEIAAAASGAPRKKFTAIEDMLGVLD